MSDDGSREPTIAEEKRALRRFMRQRLAEFDPSARQACSETLVARLIELPAWKNARRVLLFAPLPSEPDLDRLWRGGCLAGKVCIYPVVARRELMLYRVDQPDELSPVPPWNLREPAPHPANRVRIGDVDLMLVPGLAFDSQGGRLGRGGGFYDRLLATRVAGRSLAIGVGFAFQLLGPLPLAPHDAQLDGVVVC